jgi:uncharacterized membrane protein YuzA (DUF378 family)
MDNLFLRKKIELVSLFFVVVGALNWGLVSLGFNLVEFIARYTFSSLETVVYVIVGISALVHIVSRNYYLPFLGDAAFPCGSMVEKIPVNANTEVKIQVAPKTNVIYWATETHDEIMKNPWLAYEEFSNAGVVRSDVNGVAVLKFRKPSGYKVGHKTLEPHVHYRVCKHPGMLEAVKTVYM